MKRYEFQNIWLHKTGKVAMLARIINSDVRQPQILHDFLFWVHHER